jgi:hypothetical protein
MRQWSWWRWAWVAWLALFLVIEGVAIFNDTDDDTLSEFVWDFIVVNPVGWLGIAVLLGWLIKHFLFEKDKT